MGIYEIFVLIIGIILIVLGIISIAKKALWVHQGFAKRPVKVAPYTRYMGILDIVGGVLLIGYSVFHLRYNINPYIMVGAMVLYFVLTLYGEFRFKEDNANNP